MIQTPTHNPKSLVDTHQAKHANRSSQQQTGQDARPGLVPDRDWLQLVLVVIASRPRVLITDTDSSRLVRDWRRRIVNQQTHYCTKHVHALARTRSVINTGIDKDAAGPVESAGTAQVTSCALGDGGFSGFAKDREDNRLGEGCELSDNG